MKEILSFFKELFMISDDNSKIGLSQFKEEEVVEVKPAKVSKDIKLSDLMRRSA